MKHGQGTFIWESGNKYIGGYLEDVRHGYGEMYWADGSNYKGDWDSGMQHGFGTVTMIDGLEKRGKYEKNVYICAVKDDTEKPSKIIRVPGKNANGTVKTKDSANDAINFIEKTEMMI